MHAEPAYSSTNDQKCPRCGAPLVRVPRRFIDRVFSLVVPLHRFRCSEIDCSWQGTRRVRVDAPAETAEDES